MKTQTKKKKTLDYDKLYKRILKYFDKLNMLSYERDDIQMLKGKKNYFRAVALKTKGIAYKVDELDAYNRPEQDDLPQIYICTQNNAFGVPSKKDLPKAWCEKFVEVMQDKELFQKWPKELQALDAASVEELELKTSILGC